MEFIIILIYDMLYIKLYINNFITIKIINCDKQKISKKIRNK